MASLPRVLAQQSIRWAQAIAVGTGSLKDADRQAVGRVWERDAAGGRRVLRATSRESHAAMLAGAGIGIRLVKPD